MPPATMPLYMCVYYLKCHSPLLLLSLLALTCPPRLISGLPLWKV